MQKVQTVLPQTSDSAFLREHVMQRDFWLWCLLTFATAEECLFLEESVKCWVGFALWNLFILFLLGTKLQECNISGYSVITALFQLQRALPTLFLCLSFKKKQNFQKNGTKVVSKNFWDMWQEWSSSLSYIKKFIFFIPKHKFTWSFFLRVVSVP